MKRATVIILVRERLILMAAVALLIGTAAFCAATRAVRTMAPIRDVVCGKTVAIDPGHGGPDGGARGRSSGIPEKDINLDIAMELRTLLSRVAVYTVMTREDDHDLLPDGADVTGSRKRAELGRRAELVNAKSPDIFVTIHSNSFPEPQWSGAQVFYNPASEEGKKLAQHIQAELVRRLGPNTRKARPADVYLLRKVAAPSALVEVGFLSNPREERLLLDPVYRKRVSEAIYYGIVSYFLDAADRQQTSALDNWGLVRKVMTDDEPTEDTQQASTEMEIGSKGDAGKAEMSGAAREVSPDTAVLYFGGPTNFEDSLMQEMREIPGLKSMDKAAACRGVLEALVAGPGKDSILQPTIPQGTVVRGVKLEGDTAVVDMSPEIVLNHWGGSVGEELTVYSIVNTLTEFPYVKKVRIEVDGKPLETITGHMEIDGPLVRDLSIVRFR